MSFTLTGGVLYGFGRDISDHGSLKCKQRSMKSRRSLITTVDIPPSIKDDGIGEVKLYVFGGHLYAYTYFFGKRNVWNFPEEASEVAKKMYFDSVYKNVLWNLSTQQVVPLHYEKYPGNGTTHKNFLLFQRESDTLMVTSVNPHMIFSVNVDTGLMHCISETTELHFNPDHQYCLSGGPILTQKGYLVAAHIKQGGWGGLRKTFFYVFDHSHPFNPIAFTPLIDFGFSATLEYCTQIFEHESFVFVSLGVNDTFSVLLKIPLGKITSLLVPIEKFDGFYDVGNVEKIK